MERPYHTLEKAEVLRRVKSREQGLTPAEAERRLRENGKNRLAEGKKRGVAAIFLSQFKDLMIWVLLGAALVSAAAPLLAHEEPQLTDAAIILVVVVLNGILGTVQEYKAAAALAALKKMAAPSARCLRGGQLVRLPADELVAGDIVHLSAGDCLPADVRLLECHSLKVEESALTGESVPAEKSAKAVSDENAPPGDRLCMGFMGTFVTYGRGTAVVTAVGMDTEMGKIAGQLSSGEPESTPLQKKLNQISNAISIGVLAIAGVIFILSLFLITAPEGENPVIYSFMIAVSLAVSAIPEGMVAVVTIVLALGMRKMAGQGAIIRRLPAVETLGSAQVICSDKTGTLTQNRMTVTETAADDPALLREAMLHCNNSVMDKKGRPQGDPTENALLDFLCRESPEAQAAIENRTRAGEIPFDSSRKLSTVAVRRANGYRLYTKGAPDAVLARCVISPAGGRRAERDYQEMSSRALRVLAFAYKDVVSLDLRSPGAAENGLTYIGLTGMIDPARPEARTAIATCRRAGIVPIMITGDHKNTAAAIARELGILDAGEKRRAVTGAELSLMTEAELDAQVENIAVYARVSPEHKTRIVSAWQRRGKISAMTGDGVNDAPALKSADIGVGMGKSGTEVAKGASDMVLTDDNFATIVLAVGEGRRIYDNIHKTVRFLLSSNAGEVLAVLISTLLGWKLLLPVHILWINLVTDTFPALGLGAEPAEPDIMSRPPRDPQKPFFTAREWFRVAFTGAVECALTLAAYLLGGGPAHPERAMAMAFMTLSLSQLFAAIAFQSERHSVFNIRLREHKPLIFAFLGSFALQLLVFIAPPLRSLFSLGGITPLGWMQIAALCLIMLLAVELQKLAARFASRC